MRNAFFLSLLASLIVPMTALTGCNEVKKVSPKFKPGQTITKKVSLKSNLLMIFPNSDNKSTEMTLKMKVLDVDSNNSAQVRVTVDSIKANFLTLGRKFNYNSEVKPDPKSIPKNKTLASQNEKFTNAFKSLKGQQYTAVVNADGKVTELKDFDPIIKKLAYDSAKPDMLGGDQARMLFTQNNLREYVSPLLANGIKVLDDKGKSQTTGSIFVPYCPLIALVKEFIPDPDNKTEKGEIFTPYKTSLAPQQPEKSPYHSGSSFIVTYCNGSGKAYFSPKSKKIVRLEEKTVIGVRSSAVPPRAAKTPDGKERPKPKIEYVVNLVIEEL